jgi:aminodeoxyfutalosine deaminase
MIVGAKIELHVHLEGTVRPAALLDIARRNGVALPSTSVEGLRSVYDFRGIDQFFRLWRMTTRCLRHGDDFRRVAVDYAAEAAGHGAVYLEATFVGSDAVRAGRGDELFTGYMDGAAEAYDRFGILMRYTPDLYRGMEPEIAEQIAALCVRYGEQGVVGLGLGGIEGTAPVAAYRRAFQIARDGGLSIVPHAGESAGPASIREVLTLDPRRIRHGIRAVEDPELMAEIAARSVILDVCPTSNVYTAAVASLDEHPLPALIAAGIRCSIGTDDPAMFNTNLTREYDIAASLGVTADMAYEAGLAGALCDRQTWTRLRSRRPVRVDGDVGE